MQWFPNHFWLEFSTKTRYIMFNLLNFFFCKHTLILKLMPATCKQCVIIIVLYFNKSSFVCLFIFCCCFCVHTCFCISFGELLFCCVTMTFWWHHVLEIHAILGKNAKQNHKHVQKTKQKCYLLILKFVFMYFFNQCSTFT